MSEPLDSREPKRALSRAFAFHYAEMALVMLVGMALLAIPGRWASGALLPDVNGDDPALMLARMSLIMTAPMVPWMLWRGHGWRASIEMAAAMIAPAIAAVALLEAGLVEGVAVLMAVEHVAMFAAMFLAMVARPEEYRDNRSVSGLPPLAPRGASR